MHEHARTPKVATSPPFNAKSQRPFTDSYTFLTTALKLNGFNFPKSVTAAHMQKTQGKFAANPSSFARLILKKTPSNPTQHHSSLVLNRSKFKNVPFAEKR